MHQRARALQILPRHGDVGVKQILERAAAHGPRLQLRQVDLAQREHAQRLEQRARRVRQRKHDHRLVGLLRIGRRLADQDEARDVLLEILDARFQNRKPEHLRGTRRCDGGRVADLLLANHLRAACRVVRRDDLDALQARQKAFALGQPLGMRVHLLDVLHRGARKRQEVVRDLQEHFGHHRQLVLEQQVVVAVNAAADRILDGQDPVRGFAGLHLDEHLVEAHARDRRGVRAESQRRRFAIRARFSLKRNPQDQLPASSCQLPVIKKATIRCADDGLGQLGVTGLKSSAAIGPASW